MSGNAQAFRRALLRATIITALVVPATACGGAPDRAARPDPRPDPAAEWREDQRAGAGAQDAYERELREDWLDWQRDRGGTYREFLRERQEAERRLREETREERLERLSPEPDGEGLADRLEAQRQESFERLEERTPEQRLRPDTLRRNRPGLRN
jgi:hypothetical protein